MVRLDQRRLAGVLLLIGVTALGAWGTTRPAARFAPRFPRRSMLEQRQCPAEPVDDTTSDGERPHAVLAATTVSGRPGITRGASPSSVAVREVRPRRLWRRKIPPSDGGDLPSS